MPMGNRIRELREARGWTLEELAVKVGTSFQQISRLEKEHRGLSDKWMARLAQALGVKKADLLVEDAAGPAPRQCEFAQDPDELRLLQAFRDLDPRDRDAFFRLLDALAAGGQGDDLRRKRG